MSGTASTAVVPYNERPPVGNYYVTLNHKKGDGKLRTYYLVNPEFLALVTQIMPSMHIETVTHLQVAPQGAIPTLALNIMNYVRGWAETERKKAPKDVRPGYLTSAMMLKVLVRREINVMATRLPRAAATLEPLYKTMSAALDDLCKYSSFNDAHIYSEANANADAGMANIVPLFKTAKTSTVTTTPTRPVVTYTPVPKEPFVKDIHTKTVVDWTPEVQGYPIPCTDPT